MPDGLRPIPASIGPCRLLFLLPLRYVDGSAEKPGTSHCASRPGVLSACREGPTSTPSWLPLGLRKQGSDVRPERPGEGIILADAGQIGVGLPVSEHPRQ